MLIYFLVGFVCIVFLKLNMVALVIVGALLALIRYNYKPGGTAGRGFSTCP